MKNDFHTLMVARETHSALQERDQKLGWTETSVSPIEAEDAHFFVTDGWGRKYRVTITPEA